MTADGESWRTVRHMDNHENIRARIGARLEANARAVLDVPETWIPHLGELDTKLVAINPGYSVAQVKSKFGGLRFYAFPSRDDVTATVDWSATITEAGDNLHIEIPGVGAGSAPTRAAVRTAIATMLSEAGAIGPLRVHLEYADEVGGPNVSPLFVPSPADAAVYALISEAEQASYLW